MSQQAIVPRPTPNPGTTPPPPPVAATHATAVPDDLPWPQPPLKPNLEEWSHPSWSSRVVDALAAQAATRHNQNLVPRRLADARAEPPKGKLTSMMQLQPLLAAHPFTPTLSKWQHGIEVDCGPDRAWEVIEAVVACGPHPTASTPDSINLFKEDIAYQVKAGFCKIMLWEDLKRL
jgi:hypothetical protein